MEPDVKHELTGLAARLGALSAVDFAGLAPSEQGSTLVAFEELSSRFEAVRLACTGAWDAVGSWALDGALNGAVWLRANTGTGIRDARRQTRTARVLRRAPVLAAAFASGKLTASKVALLAPLAEGDTAELFARDEAILVEQSVGLTTDEVARLVRYWRSIADDALSRPDETAAELEAKQAVHVHTTDAGAVVADMTLAPIGGAIWQNELERLCEEIWKASTERERADINPAQRRALALVEMARRSADWTATMTGRAVPLFTAVIDVDTMAGRNGPVCNLANGTRITPADVQEWLAKSDFAPLITDPKGAVLYFGRTRRYASPKQRQAVIIRDRHCAFAGCDRPAGWSDVHHLWDWDQGGSTDIDNMILLCSRHHHQVVHKQGFTAQREPDTGRLVWRRPDGTVIPQPFGDWRPNPQQRLFPRTDTTPRKDDPP
jgi:hypothetical protein